MPRDQAHTELRQWPLPDGRTATTVHRVDDDGEDGEADVTGIHERLHLTLEVRGHEMSLPERERRGAR